LPLGSAVQLLPLLCRMIIIFLDEDLFFAVMAKLIGRNLSQPKDLPLLEIRHYRGVHIRHF